MTKHLREEDHRREEDKKSERFDEMLSAAIDKTLRYVLGDINTGVVYNYLEKRGLSLKEIPANPGEFSTELKNTRLWKRTNTRSRIHLRRNRP